MRIARRTTCRSEEAGGKPCASWYGPVATGVSVLQRSALVVLHVDRKRQVGQQQQSWGILFREIIFSFSLFSERERVSVGADWSSTMMQISRSRWQDSCLVVWSGCNRDVSLAMIRACRVARRSQTTSRPATTVLGNSFSRNYFFFSLSRTERPRFG